MRRSFTLVFLWMLTTPITSWAVCTDTDPANDPTVVGTVTITGRPPASDTCSTARIVRQVNCSLSQKSFSRQNTTCPARSSCVGGRCVSPPPPPPPSPPQASCPNRTCQPIFVRCENPPRLPNATTCDSSWTRIIQTPGFDAALGIEVDVNGTIFTATQQGNRDNGNFVVTSWDSCGNRIWQSLSPGGVTYSESSIQGSTTDHIDLDSCGNVYVVGPSTGSRDPVRDEAFVKKYSFTGDLIWADFFDPPGEHPGLLGYTHAGGIAVSPDGSIYVVGYGFERSGGTQTLGWVRKYRPNGSSEWTQTVALNDDSVEFKAVAADDTGAFITGRSRQKIYLAKFSPGGTVVWSFNDALTPATSDFLTTGYDVEIGPDGMLNLAVGQSTYAFTTVGVAKFDTSGNLTGTATYAGHERAISSNHASRGIAVASDGGVYIAGYQAPGSLGIKKFNNDLDLSWERFVTHAGSTAATCGLNAMAINLALDSRGFAYSIGHYVGTTSGIMSGPTSEIPCTSRDHYTVILDKIGPNGENSGWPETPPLSP